MMTEASYQRSLIKKIEDMFPGVTVLKNNPDHIQGIPDISILWRKYWAALEVKLSADSAERPNQRYWVERLNEESFAAFIYPENEKEVLDALQLAFGASG